ncbi:hypothetical protein [Candidatus Cardinium hertigii]|jgi:hypothetical protein|uniref:Uncharacterized protein n=1 Tax=Candidatus Cardinium hertigii TaxID=247481 RepID=A0A3N2QBZ9_9BACT|nr:hypothetical protein [Candidatus Cardinium hertigii]ROT47330.1 hypothetical protein EDM02_02725 [Candidatus Cardinium hertigii]
MNIFMIKLRVTLSATLAISSFFFLSGLSGCGDEKSERGLYTHPQGHPVRDTSPVPEKQIANVKPLHFDRDTSPVPEKQIANVKPLHFDKDNPDQACLKILLYADRKEISNKIKSNPVLLNSYRNYMGCDPTGEDIGNCLLAASVFFTEADRLVIELGKKATHPAFEVMLDFRAFIANKLALRYKVNLDAPVDQYALECWNAFKNDLKQLTTVISKIMNV